MNIKVTSMITQMNPYLSILLIIILLTPSVLADLKTKDVISQNLLYADLEAKDVISHNLLYAGRHVPRYLSKYFTIYECEITESSKMKDHTKKLNKIVKNKYPFLSGKDLKKLKWKTYIIEDHPNVLFFYSQCINFLLYGYGYNIAYNQTQDTYLFLKKPNIEKINEILQTEKFALKYDSDILTFCFLITILKNSTNPVRLIASLEDLYVESAIKFPIHNKLNYFRTYEDIEITFPKIINNSNEIIVEFCIARNDVPKKKYEVIKVYISLRDSRVIEYNEEKIADCFQL